MLLHLVVVLVVVAPAHLSMPLCAVGDLHGDLNHALQALALCGAVDAAGSWIGGNLTVVQTGDILDRGSESLLLLQKMWSLQQDAATAGGELLLLMGNHELLNMQGKTHYVDPEEMAAFGGAAAWREAMDPQTGEVGHRIAGQPGVAVRGHGACRTLFLHAGLRLTTGAAHGHNLSALNAELTSQVRANSGALLDARTGPLWFRGYARPHSAGLEDDEACAEVRAAIATSGDGAQRMTVGHNIVPFVATRCSGAYHMIDVGMSTAYGGRPAAWRCTVDASGQAEVRALYHEGEEAPPDLCTACRPETLRPMHAHAALRGSDPHGDCRNYCRSVRGSAARRMAGQAGASGGGPAPSAWSQIFSALGSGMGGGGAQDAPSASEPIVANHVKTEF